MEQSINNYSSTYYRSESGCESCRLAQPVNFIAIALVSYFSVFSTYLLLITSIQLPRLAASCLVQNILFLSQSANICLTYSMRSPQRVTGTPQQRLMPTKASSLPMESVTKQTILEPGPQWSMMCLIICRASDRLGNMKMGSQQVLSRYSLSIRCRQLQDWVAGLYTNSSGLFCRQWVLKRMSPVCRVYVPSASWNRIITDPAIWFESNKVTLNSVPSLFVRVCVWFSSRPWVIYFSFGYLVRRIFRVMTEQYMGPYCQFVVKPQQ